MTVRHQQFSSELPVSAATALDWHGREGAFERLTPPWMRVDVVSQRGTIAPNDGKDLRIGMGPVKVNWKIEHEALSEGRGFADRQISGPFRTWRHHHRFEDIDPTTSRLSDDIAWDLPFSRASQPIIGSRIAADMDRLFRFRHDRTRTDLLRHAAWADHPPMTVAITGASGLVGRNLAAFLQAGGHRVIRITRAPARTANDVSWNPETGSIDAARLEGVDAVVHLAGTSIAGGRWTASRKASILNSRVEGTHLLVRTLARLERRPRVLVSTSAVGYYGSQPGAVLLEHSPAGEGFLADVCGRWEAAAEEASSSGIRVVLPRFGIVLSGYGGMLPLIARAFRLGGGGRLGSGRQSMSWIALDDLIGVLHHAIMDTSISGVVNAVSPTPVTNAEFTRALARALRRPAVLNVPGVALKAVGGELADELLLTDQHVVPQRLQQAAFPFFLDDLGDALRFELGTRTWGDPSIPTGS